MRLVFNLKCLYFLPIFVSSQSKWQTIINHQEEVFIDLTKNVSSWLDARNACDGMQSINLVLWRKPVLDFVNIFLNQSSCKYITNTFVVV